MSVKSVLFGVFLLCLLAYGTLTFVGNYNMPYGCWSLPAYQGCRFSVEPSVGKFLGIPKRPDREVDLSFCNDALDDEFKSRAQAILSSDSLLSKDFGVAKKDGTMVIGHHIATRQDFLASICGAKGFTGLEYAYYTSSSIKTFVRIRDERCLKIWCKSV